MIFDAFTHPALLMSLRVSLLAMLIAVPLGVGIATLLARPRFWGKEFWDAIFTAPMVLPPTVLGYYLLVALGPQSVVGRAYESVFGTTIAFRESGAAVAATLGALPLIIKAARPALEAVNPSLVAVAHTLGASRWYAYRTVAIPLSARAICGGGALGLAKSLGDFGVTWMLVGAIPGRTETAAIYVYNELYAGREGNATAMVVVLTVLALALLYVANKLSAPRYRAFEMDNNR